MATEVELKLAIVSDASVDPLQVLKVCLSDQQMRYVSSMDDLRNTYFDTKSRGLNAAKMALRVREKNGQFIQTLKTKGASVNGLSRRGEWEWSINSLELDASLLRSCEAWPAELNVFDLRPAFETNFTRYQFLFEWRGSSIELALDQGFVLSGGKSEAIN